MDGDTLAESTFLDDSSASVHYKTSPLLQDSGSASTVKRENERLLRRVVLLEDRLSWQDRELAALTSALKQSQADLENGRQEIEYAWARLFRIERELAQACEATSELVDRSRRRNDHGGSSMVSNNGGVDASYYRDQLMELRHQSSRDQDVLERRNADLTAHIERLTRELAATQRAAAQASQASQTAAAAAQQPPPAMLAEVMEHMRLASERGREVDRATAALRQVEAAQGAIKADLARSEAARKRAEARAHAAESELQREQAKLVADRKALEERAAEAMRQAHDAEARAENASAAEARAVAAAQEANTAARRAAEVARNTPRKMDAAAQAVRSTEMHTF